MDNNLSVSAPYPSLAMRIVQWAVPDELQEPIAGDLLEEYYDRYQRGKPSATLWLYRQCFSTVTHFAFKTQRGSLMFLIALLVLSSVVLMALWLSGELSQFVNIPSLIIVVPPALLFARASVSAEVFKQAFKCLVDSKYKTSLESTKPHAKMFNVMGNSAMLMGWFGVVAGAIAMASNIEPEIFKDVIGPATAVCLLTLMYALIMKAFCYVAELSLMASE